jgi:uncharacterized protein YdaU (DUF1376 family)
LFYFQINIGDWAKRTAHLTAFEEGILFRLVRLYADTEKPLPSEVAAVYRLARARGRAEKQAVDAMLAEQFVLADGGYSNVELDAQIERYRAKTSKAKASAKARWQPAGMDASAMPTHAEIDATAMQTDMRTHAESHADAMLTVNRKPETENRKPKTHTTQPATTVDTTDAGFVCFWDKYPRITRRVGRDQCWKLWKEKNLDSMLEKILVVLAEDSTSEQWTKDEGRYVPKPFTWLSEGHYQREAATPPPKPVCRACGNPHVVHSIGTSWYCKDHSRAAMDGEL